MNTLQDYQAGCLLWSGLLVVATALFIISRAILGIICRDEREQTTCKEEATGL